MVQAWCNAYGRPPVTRIRDIVNLIGRPRIVSTSQTEAPCPAAVINVGFDDDIQAVEQPDIHNPTGPPAFMQLGPEIGGPPRRRAPSSRSCSGRRGVQDPNWKSRGPGVPGTACPGTFRPSTTRRRLSLCSHRRGRCSRDVSPQDRRPKLVTSRPERPWHTPPRVRHPTNRRKRAAAPAKPRPAPAPPRASSSKHMAAAPGSMADGGRNLTSTTPAPATLLMAPTADVGGRAGHRVLRRVAVLAGDGRA